MADGCYIIPVGGITMNALMNHIGTILVAAILLLCVIGILYSLYSDKKGGKASCGCNCGGCCGCKGKE